MTYPQPVNSRARLRRALLTVLAVALLLALPATGVAIARPGLVAGLVPSGGKPQALWQSEPAVAPMPGPVLEQLADGVAPSAAGLSDVLDPLLAETVLGKQVSVSVADVATGATLYSRDADKRVTPASNVKILTAAAVLATRGPGYRITTRAVAGAQPGEVVLVGAGDATLAIDGDGYYAGAGRLDALATQVKKALGDPPPTKLIIDGSVFSGPQLGPQWAADAPDEGYVSKITGLMVDGGRTDPKDHYKDAKRHSDPQLFAGLAFAKLLGIPGKAVSIGIAPTAADIAPTPSTDISSVAPTGTPSAGNSAAVAPGTVLGEVRSAPILRQVEQMLTESDNTLAEALARQVALAKGQPASFSGAAAALTSTAIELGLPAAQIDIADGSGYSRLNKLTAGALTGLIATAASGTKPELVGLFNGLPVVGWSGTMNHRFTKDKKAHGVVRAKSGTLAGVNSIAGVLQTADGRLLAFGVLADGVPVDQLTAQDALDRIVATVAACGCR